MIRQLILAAILFSSVSALAQIPAPRPKFDAFEVATITPTDPGSKAGRFITIQGTHRFVVKNYTLKLLIAAAYDLNPQAVCGGPAWLDSDHYDILAETPGDVRPTHDEQMSMVRTLLTDRFQLAFHRQPKVFSIYQLEATKSGPRLKPTAAAQDDPPTVGPAVVYPGRVVLPGRNATMHDLTTLLQRAILDRAVVDRTGLTGRYDFDLEWAPDETQFGGALPPAPSDAPTPPLFTALQEQLGLRLEATRGPIPTLVVDHINKPSAN
jgi:uncharacterized protein (TIGR03435 family)